MKINTRLFNFPVFIPIEQYQEAIADFISIFSSDKNVKALYQYGSITDPGLSDLDLIIVLDDFPDKFAHNAINKERYSKKLKLITDYASLIIFPITNFQRLLVWDDLKVQQIFGSDINLDEIYGQEVSVARIVDWLPERIIRICELIDGQEINVRKALGTIKSCGYSINKIMNLTSIVDQSALKLLSEYSYFRQTWFELTEKDQIDGLYYFIKSMKSELLNAFHNFNNWINVKYFYGITDNVIGGSLNIPNQFTYQFRNENPDYMPIGIQSNGKYSIQLPIFYLMHYIVYTKSNGAVSRSIGKNLRIEGKFNQLEYGSMRQILNERITLCNFWAKFLNENNFSGGLFKLSWFN